MYIFFFLIPMGILIALEYLMVQSQDRARAMAQIIPASLLIGAAGYALSILMTPNNETWRLWAAGLGALGLILLAGLLLRKWWMDRAKL